MNGLPGISPLNRTANLRHYTDWERENTYPHYHAGWAMAGNTPFRYFKQSEHRGGQQDALVVHWPKGIKAQNEIRSQYHHIADIAPTILEAAGITVPETYHGVKQQPMDGKSMFYSFNNPKAPNVKNRQYYEMFGNRAIWVDGWKAVTLHANRMPWEVNVVLPFENDKWELYHVEKDFSESTDLSKKYPEKLKELQEIFDEEAWKYGVYPLYDYMIKQDKVHALVADYSICIVALLRYPDAGFISIHTTLTYEPYGIALPPNDPYFINWVETSTI
ncbi:MAG: sulfatase-like hydrolase/transferase [Desulfobacterales bacterium]|nr:sulfatase-like hydrolase/transferase [Desulfobacterales bacterium]